MFSFLPKNPTFRYSGIFCEMHVLLLLVYMVEQKTAKNRLVKAEPFPISQTENDCMNGMARC